MGADVRRATEADVDALVALNRHVQDLHVAALPERYRPTDADDVAAWFRGQLGAAGTQIWLATVDGPAGYVVTKLVERPSTPFSHASRSLLVDQIAVDADARRHGVGRALMAKAEAIARESGCTRVELDVLAFNEGAAAFYAALGYRPMQTRLFRPVA